MTSLPIWILVGVFGAVIGSFLNVVIHRLPLGQSIVKPRSHCPACQNPVRFYDNIPLLSFLILRGRCRDCHAKISFRYFFVELLTTLLSLATYFYFREIVHYLVYFLLLIAPLIAVIFIDLQHRIIPNEITLPGIVIGVLVHYWDAPPAWEISALIESLVGIVVGGGFLFVVAFAYEKIKRREGLGGGDVKLAAMFGAFFGWQAVMMILLIASVLGSLIGLMVVAFKRNWLYQIPFGPFLAAAAYLQFFFGDPILQWYLSLLQK